MGALSTIAGLIRQANIDEMNKKRYEQQLSAQADAERRQNEYSEKMSEVSRLSAYTQSLEREAQQLEEQVPMLAANGDPRAQIVFDRIKSLRDPQSGEIALNRANLGVLGQNMKMSLARDNPKLQMALISEYLSNAGVDPKSVKEEPTVKFKSKRKGQNFGDEDEVSFEVAASEADKFVQGGAIPLPSSASRQPPASNMNLLGALASSTQTGVPASDSNMFAQFQPSGGNVSPMSTGEQPVTAGNLFQQPQAQSSANPFTPAQPQQKRKRFNPVTGQIESY